MNIGIQDGLLEEKHIRAMGPAVWLFMWCIRCQTPKSNFVWGGKPVTYEQIANILGIPGRTVKRWAARLILHRYISFHYRNYKMLAIEINKPKKWTPKQGVIQFSNDGPKMAYHDGPEVAHRNAKSGPSKQTCSLRKTKEEIKAEEGTASSEILRAFDALGYKTPFGVRAFQDDWAEEYPRINGGGFTEAMENTIQRCQAKHIKVPNLFFALKRQVEKMEVAQRFKEHPL